MSTEFRPSMDPQSKDIVLDGKFIGFLQWHKGPFTVSFQPLDKPLPLGVLEDILTERERILSERKSKK